VSVRPGIPWLTVEDVLAATGGTLRRGAAGAGLRFAGCSIDSRSLRDEELFVPLPGANVDGHAFVAQALEGPAGGSLVGAGHSWSPGSAPVAKPVIEVPEPLDALQAIGRHCRERSGVPAVAVTGSNGKTTTKEMIAAVLGVRLAVHRNVGNLNNHIGVPLTLSHLAPEHQVLVIEMGMSARGEIRFLASLSRPEVGVLTNASPAHLAQLGTVEEIARAKSELAEALPPDGLLVVNADDALLWTMNRGRPVTVRGYAIDNPDADLRPTSVSDSGDGGTRFTLPDGTEVTLALLGRHNVRNALAAILVGDRFGIPRSEAARALGALRPARHRLERMTTAAGIAVIDDTYNANPASMRAALALLGTMETRGARRAVLGDMLELGPDAPRLHEEVGRAVPRTAWLYAAGAHAADLERGALAAGVDPSRIRRFEDVPAMAEAVVKDARPGDLVLVKASRGMRLERVVEALAPGSSGSHDGEPASARAGRA
jgi:UDP-N-acetylmuramoyl-tripeptide--D-alanyl-D-alanine ligase